MEILLPEERVAMEKTFAQSLVKVAKRVGPLKRVGELLLGTRAKNLSAAARKHITKATVAEGDKRHRRAVGLTQAINVMMPHIAKSEEGQAMLKHLAKKTNKTRGTISHHARAAAKLRSLSDIEGLKVFGTRAGLLAGAAKGLEHLSNKKQEKHAMKTACARELLYMGAVLPCQALALTKQADVSPDEARRSLDRLSTLEQNKPTVSQAARYGAVGGAGGATIGAIGNLIEHGNPLKGTTAKAKALNLASSTIKGAIGGGAIPLVRNALDRRAEQKILGQFMQENVGAKHA